MDVKFRYVNAIAVPLLSRQDIAHKQKCDTFCLEQQKKSEYIFDNDGLLYYNIGAEPRLVIPQTLIQTVTEQRHDTVFSGHQGVKKTIGILKPRYYCPTLVKNVEEYISKCVSCNQRKTV